MRSTRRPLTLAAMVLAATLAPASPLAPASAAPVLPSAECAAPEPAVAGGLEVRAKPGAKVAEPAASPGGPDLLQGKEPTAVSPAGSIEVDTYVHVIAAGPTRAQGFLTQAEVDRQMALLNSAYAGQEGPSAANTPFRFDTVDTDWTIKPEWYEMLPGSAAEKAAKQSLRQGTDETLNVYLSGLGGGLLGYAYFPQQGGNSKLWQDGVVVLNESIPGGAVTSYNQGDTLPHEVGHWLGLYHTFQGGCSTANDRVSDTPAMSVPTGGCPTGKDTCAKDPGLDPVENFMDYSYDRCMYAFTPGQSARMDAIWKGFRAGSR